MDMHEENLSQFSLSAAELLDEFWLALENIGAGEADFAAAQQSLQAVIGLLQRMGELASELDVLQTVFMLLEADLQAVQAEDRTLNAQESGLLQQWLEQLMSYMLGHGEANALDGMISNLENPVWRLPLSSEDIEILKNMYGTSIVSENLSVQESRAQYSMQPQEGVMDEEIVSSVVLKADTVLFDNSVEGIIAAGEIPSAVQEVDSEMISMLNNEFALMDKQLNEDMATICNGQASAQERRIALTNYTELLERMGAAAEAIGLLVLGKIFEFFMQGVMQIGFNLNSAQAGVLKQLPGRVSAYLTWPTDASACSGLIDLLVDEKWPHVMDTDTASIWISALSNIEVIEGSAHEKVRQSVATDDDVSVALPDDINAELLDGLLQELPAQTSAFTAAIERIAAGYGTANDISRAMRSAHTLKGAANTVGIRGIANLTHHLEDILEALSDAGLMPDQALSAMLVEAGDCLEAMSEALMGVGPAPEQARKVLQAVLDYAIRIDLEGVAVVAASDVVAIHVDAEPEVDNSKAANKELQMNEHGQGMRVSTPVVDELLRLAGETLIANSQIQDRLRQTVKQADAMRQQQQLVGQLVAELESLVDIRGVAAPLQNARAANDFDPLEFDNFSELHTVTRRLIEASADSQQIMSQVNEQFSTLSDLLEVQQRLQMANQHAVIRTRLVPVSGVVSRLQRSVRQTCRLLDKQVELVITGDTTNIDSNVLSDLMDPLMHILRNAVDHGIESPQARAAAGKTKQGRIELAFSREGNSIVVRCKDDGVGLDYAAIRRIAESKGMIAPERNPTPEELARLILVNGFSTRDEATQVSGRGVGMDVVYNRVLQMKGTLALNSESGMGLMVELRLPATLLSAHSLIVRHGEKLIALSSRGVEDIHYATPDKIESLGLQQMYRVGNNAHNLIRLESLLGLPTDRREQSRLGFPVLITRMENGVVNAILVQEVLDGRDVVLKNFGRYVPKIHGSIGAVILGDGSVAPVIDLVELLRTPVQHTLTAKLSAQSSEPVQLSPDTLTALVVDDSLTARRAAAKVMKDAGYTVRTAIDGLEAVAILQNFVPDVMLVDMEMPRMNGLELTSHVRNADRTKQIPVIMITSRSTEKHRQQAKTAGVNVYLTKPFSDEALLTHAVRLVGR
jgi:chemotaxis protein histidine kinase CheA